MGCRIGVVTDIVKFIMNVINLWLDCEGAELGDGVLEFDGIILKPTIYFFYCVYTHS